MSDVTRKDFIKGIAGLAALIFGGSIVEATPVEPAPPVVEYRDKLEDEPVFPSQSASFVVQHRSGTLLSTNFCWVEDERNNS